MNKTNVAKEEHRDTLIGAGTVLDGSTFDLEYDIRVDGILRSGRLVTRQVLTVGSEGSVRAASIEVGEAVIEGQVDGLLRARKCVQLRSGARFKGVLQTPKLVIEEGARLEEGVVEEWGKELG